MPTLSLSSDARIAHLSSVVKMIEASYQYLPMPKVNPDNLLTEFSVWMIHDGAVELCKETLHGIKICLCGTDGTEAGKRAMLEAMNAHRAEDGIYAEVSHKMETLCKKLRFPVVRAVDAMRVLNKTIRIHDDGIHYTREVRGIGVLSKVMIGRPIGIETVGWP